MDILDRHNKAFLYWSLITYTARGNWTNSDQITILLQISIVDIKRVAIFL